MANKKPKKNRNFIRFLASVLVCLGEIASIWLDICIRKRQQKNQVVASCFDLLIINRVNIGLGISDKVFFFHFFLADYK